MIANPTGFRTLLGKEVHRFMRLWSQTLLPPVISASLYILIFGYSLGNRMPEMGANSYLQFILPGLILMGVVSAAFANTSSSIFSSKFQGSIHEILVAPLAYVEVVLAYAIAGMLRGFLVGLLTMAVGLLLTPLPIYNLFVLLVTLVAVSGVFSCLGIIAGLWATNFDRLSIFPTFILTPLIYLGGVFYSIDLLPQPWQTISHVNPLFYMINSFRYGFLGVSDVPVFSSLVVLAILFCALFAFTVWLLRTGYNTKT